MFGSYERRQLVFWTVNFLRTALCYAKEFPQLSNIIFHSSTLNAVIEVLPEFLFHKIRETDEYIADIDKLYSNSESMMVKIKEIMELEQMRAIKDVEFHETLMEKHLMEKEIAFGNASAAQSTPIPSPKKNGKPVSKPSQDCHDCKKSKTCNERWGGLGCVKIYKLATVNEQREHLKKLKLCFCCGLSFHGIPWKSGGRNTPCNWDRKLDPVKCQGNSCEKGAATCLEHAE